MISGMFSRTSIMALLAGGVLALGVAVASADQILMRDGTVYDGKVVSQTRREVVIDTTINGISTRLTLDRRLIQNVTMGDVESPNPDAPQTAPTGTPGIAPAPSIGAPSIGTPAEKPAATLKREGVDLIVEIPMTGTFGQDIYPLSIAKGLEWAKEQGATDIVFRMNSPGGEVWAAEEIVEIMAKYSGSFRYHALIEHAISATIWPAFNCDTITMAPGGTFGGAVVFRMRGTGAAEVDKKMTSIMAAKLAASAEAKGHSKALVMTMMIPEEAAYAVQRGGVWTVTGEKPADGETYETIDGTDTVLTLTADQAGKYGIVSTIPNRDIAAFAESQQFLVWDHHDETTNAMAQKANDQCKRLRAELMGTIQSFYREQEISSNRNSIASYGSAVQNMNAQLGRYKILLRRAEDLQMAAIVDSFEQAIDVPFWETEIRTRMSDIQKMRRQTRP
jgi:hypothetical protein